jgi:hypothetical protein
MKIFHLVVYAGASISRVFVLQKKRVVIGRDPGCDLVLDSMNISRRHVVLCCSEDQVTIEDLASTNGTLVNGETLHAALALQPRDEILLGKEFRMIFQVVDSVRARRDQVSEGDTRPGYPLPLPQTMLLGGIDLDEHVAQQTQAEAGNRRQSTISPATIPRLPEDDLPGIGDD